MPPGFGPTSVPELLDPEEPHCVMASHVAAVATHSRNEVPWLLPLLLDEPSELDEPDELDDEEEDDDEEDDEPPPQEATQAESALSLELLELLQLALELDPEEHFAR